MTLFCYLALVLRIIDGDTFVADIDTRLGVMFPQAHVRLLGIDTPEMWGAQRERGLAARSDLVRLLPRGAEATICVEGRDSFGRVLGHVWAGDIDVDEWLTERGHVK